MDCACAYVVCCSSSRCRLCLCLYNLLGFHGRMIRRMGLGDRVGLGGTGSSGRQWWWYSLEGNLSPVNWLLGTIPEQWSSARVGGRAQKLYCWWDGSGQTQDMPWGLESGSWTHWFFQAVWAVPVPMESAGVAREGWSPGGWSGGWVSLGSRIGVGGIESHWWWQWGWCSLEADFSPAGWLLGIAACQFYEC